MLILGLSEILGLAADILVLRLRLGDVDGLIANMLGDGLNDSDGLAAEMLGLRLTPWITIFCSIPLPL
jgi:hypothetical protein